VLGALLSLYPLGQFLGSPVLGTLSDRFGRLPVLLVSLASTTVWYAVIALALAAESLPLLMVACFLAGLSEANIVIAQGAIADAAPREDRGRLFGYIYLSASLAYVAGPLGGGKLADSSLVSWFTESTPYWVVFGLLLITLAWVAMVFRETHAPDRSAPIRWLDALTSLRGVVTRRDLRAFYLANFLLYLAIFGFFRVYPMYLVDEFGLGVSAESEFIAYVAVPIVLANLWLVAALAPRLGMRTLAIFSGVATGVFMATIVIPDSVNWMWFTLGPTALGLALCLPSIAALLSLNTSDAEQGAVMGNNQSLQVGAEALSGIVGGLLAAAVVKLPLIVFAVLAVLGAAVLTRTRRTAGAEPAGASAPGEPAGPRPSGV
jgi:MFS family permease